MERQGGRCRPDSVLDGPSVQPEPNPEGQSHPEDLQCPGLVSCSLLSPWTGPVKIGSLNESFTRPGSLERNPKAPTTTLTTMDQRKDPLIPPPLRGLGGVLRLVRTPDGSDFCSQSLTGLPPLDLTGQGVYDKGPSRLTLRLTVTLQP